MINIIIVIIIIILITIILIMIIIILLCIVSVKRRITIYMTIAENIRTRLMAKIYHFFPFVYLKLPILFTYGLFSAVSWEVDDDLAKLKTKIREGLYTVVIG